MTAPLKSIEGTGDIAAAMAEIGRKSGAAARVLALASTAQKDDALARMAAAIRAQKYRILAANARVAVVILSMHQDESYVLGALKAGAKGYLLKDSLRGEVVQAIRAASQGRSFLTRKVARILQEDYIGRLHQRGLEDRYDLLSDREREVLQIIAEGRSNKEVATILGLSANTVAVHRTNVMTTLGLHKTAELVLFAVKHGLVETP